jgi:predicted nucleic acid-binding protein
MKRLLDVSTLVALLWKTHVHHQRAVTWRKGKAIVVCPITELGFIRVCTSPAYNLAMNDARKLLADFIRDDQPEFIPADTRALDGAQAPSSSKSTDWYLANLADAHAMKLATFDGGLSHQAAEQIP